jgi:hypothetical protein
MVLNLDEFNVPFLWICLYLECTVGEMIVENDLK